MTFSANLRIFACAAVLGSGVLISSCGSGTGRGPATSPAAHGGSEDPGLVGVWTGADALLAQRLHLCADGRAGFYVLIDGQPRLIRAGAWKIVRDAGSTDLVLRGFDPPMIVEYRGGIRFEGSMRASAEVDDSSSASGRTLQLELTRVPDGVPQCEGASAEQVWQAVTSPPQPGLEALMAQADEERPGPLPPLSPDCAERVGALIASAQSAQFEQVDDGPSHPKADLYLSITTDPSLPYLWADQRAALEAAQHGLHRVSSTGDPVATEERQLRVTRGAYRCDGPPSKQRMTDCSKCSSQCGDTDGTCCAKFDGDRCGLEGERCTSYLLCEPHCCAE